MSSYLQFTTFSFQSAFCTQYCNIFCYQTSILLISINRPWLSYVSLLFNKLSPLSLIKHNLWLFTYFFRYFLNCAQFLNFLTWRTGNLTRHATLQQFLQETMIAISWLSVAKERKTEKKKKSHSGREWRMNGLKRDKRKTERKRRRKERL